MATTCVNPNWAANLRAWTHSDARVLAEAMLVSVRPSVRNFSECEII
jgi:hypothetical protein